MSAISKRNLNFSSKKRAAFETLLRKEGLSKPDFRAIAPRADSAPPPLSPAQEGLWFINEFDPGNLSYNDSFAFRLIGRIDIRAFSQSINEVIRRHECLRTTFSLLDGEPVQIINPTLSLPVSVIDLTGLPEGARADEARLLAAAQARLPFDLTTGPLLRVSLSRLDINEHILLFTVHHMVSDGWSLGVLVKEVSALYEAFSQGEPSPLAELPIQYGDYCVWERERLEGVIEQQLPYWRRQLSGAPASLDLPTDRPRPPAQAHHGASRSLLIAAPLADRIKALSRQEGATTFMTLMAAFYALLYRYSGQGDICIGTPVAGRGRAETEGLIGLFANTLVLRVRVEAGMSFRRLMGEVREAALGAYQHQQVPFDRLVEQVSGGRSLSHTPLFQVMFAMQNQPAGEMRVPGLEVSRVEVESGTSKFDLLMSLEEGEQGLTGRLEYDTELWDDETVGRMVRHYGRILGCAVEEPDLEVGGIQVLDPDEERELVEGFNRTGVEYGELECVHEMVEEQAAKRGGEEALVCGERRVSYRELNEMSNLLGNYLRGLGVGPERRVGIFVERGVEMVVGLLGVMKAGGAYVPLDPAYPRQRLAFMLEDSQASVVITQSHLAADIPETAATIVCIDSEWDLIAEQGGDNPASGVSADNLAYVIYTSGSTGRPKGVAISHRSAATLLRWAADSFTDREMRCVLASTSICFDLSVFELFAPLARGCKVALADNALGLPRLAAADEVTLINTVPSAMRELVRAGGVPPSVIAVNLAGEPLRGELARQVYGLGSVARVANLYGPTEDTTYSTWEVVTRGSGGEPTIGRPIANTRVHILDGQMRAQPVGVYGELYIAGEGLARCYLSRPEMTAERFLPNPYGLSGGERLYRTGDVARYLRGGGIEYKGRADDQVKLRGYRIELGEVESVLLQHQSVSEAAAAVCEMGSGDRQIVAYIVFEEGCRQSAAELREHARRRLPEYMVPWQFVELETLPLTPNGKVDRKRLPAPEQGRGQQQAGYVAPRSDEEAKLAGIWAEVLGVGEVGVYDNFFELGGHSLLASQVMTRVREAFGVEVALRAVFEEPTVAGLAGRIKASVREDSGVGIERVSRGEEIPLSYGQQRLWFLDQLEGGSAFYNISGAMRVRGRLDVGLLEASLNEVIARHEVLRTRYEQAGGRVRQVIQERMSEGVWEVDLSGLSEQERWREVERMMSEEGGRQFDLSRGGLVRVGVIRESEEEQVVMAVMHHIVSDGWSVGVMIREVGELYASKVEGREARLAELPIQYADYSVWQKQQLSGKTLEEDLRFWKEKLEGAPYEIELAPDLRRPPKQNWRGKHIRFDISDRAAEGLRRLAREEGATRFVVMMAAFNCLLQRHTGQTDILVGTPVANRSFISLEGLIGFFSNMLAIRTDLTGDPSLRELIRRVHRNLLDAYDHQYLPFDKLVEVLQPDRDLSRSPIVQVTFAKQANPIASVQIDGLSMTLIKQANERVQFDLSMTIYEDGDKLEGAIDYSADLFYPSTIERLAHHYQILLEELAADPDQPISELTLTSLRDRQQLLEWNDTEREFPRDRFAHQLIESQARIAADSLAITCGGARLTFGELNARANQLARHLKQSGVGPEVRVAVCIERGVEMVVGMLGILKAGGAYVPIAATYPIARVRHILENAKCPLVLTQSKLSDVLADCKAEILCLDTDWELMAGHDSSDFDSEVMAANLAYIIYTSGTTGEPKGVQIEHGALLNLINWHIREFSLSPADRASQMASLGFDATVWEIWPYLAAGASLHIVDDETRMVKSKLKDWLLEQDITMSFIPTPMAELVIDEAWPGAMRLSKVLTGGDRLRKYPSPEVGFDLINFYGPTENTVIATSAVVRKTDESDKPPSIGCPIANTQVYLLDERLNQIPIGMKGELFIAGEGLSRGYCDQPALTAEKFIPHPYSRKPGARLYRTGDLARYMDDGNIEFLGRIDDQVKIRGFRIELGEIETWLSQHPAVEHAIVLTKQDFTGADRLIAFVAADNQQLGAQELRQHLRQRLPEYMIPSAFVIMGSLPLTSNNKIDRRALLELPIESLPLEREVCKPTTAIEQILADIWSELLGVEPIGVNDDFFDLGGHSLLATQLVSRVRKSLGVELALKTLFEEPTIARLGRVVESYLNASVGEQAPAILPRERRAYEPLSYEPLSFAQQRLYFLERLMPGNYVFNIPMAKRVIGDLNLDALRRSLNKIVARHEILRTRFTHVDGQVMQEVVGQADVEFSVTSLKGFPPGERETEAARIVAAESRKTFDFQNGPMLRVAVIELAAQDHIVIVVMHHIITDGWSMGLFVDELCRLYEAYSLGEDLELDDLNIQYSDYARWQSEWLQGEVIERELSYWKDALGDELPVLEMATDRPRPALQTYEGGNYRFNIGEELTRRLKSLGRQQEATMFMVLLAAFEVLLHKYTSQEKILIGTPVANRNRVEVEGLIGIFVNTVVMSGVIRGEDTFKELLSRVKETALGAYAHQDLPFEKLVDELKPERDLSRTPLFQVMFSMPNTPLGEVKLSGLRLEDLEIEAGIAKHDLTLMMEERAGTLEGVLEYNADLFEEATIKRMASHLEVLLEAIAAGANERIDDLSVLTAAERQQMVFDWNQMPLPAPDLTEECAHAIFERQTELTPYAMAVVSEEGELTYEALNRLANRIARALVERGVGPDSIVALMLDEEIDLLAASLGVFKAGGAYLTLNPLLSAEENVRLVEQTGCEALVTTNSFDSPLLDSYESSHSTTSVQVIRLEQLPARDVDKTNPAGCYSPDGIACLLPVAGSDGTTRLAMIEHRALVSQLRGKCSDLDLSDIDIVGRASSEMREPAIWGLLAPLLVGATVRVFGMRTSDDGQAVMEQIDRGRISIIETSPRGLRAMIEQLESLPWGSRPEFRSARWLVIAGGALKPELMRRWKNLYPALPLFVSYSIPECSGDIARNIIYDSPQAEGAAISLGRRAPNIRLYVLDSRLRPTPIGVAGELYIGAGHLSRGYLEAPHQTAELFLPDPFGAEMGARLFKTGIAVRYLADGSVELLSRRDYVVDDLPSASDDNPSSALFESNGPDREFVAPRTPTEETVATLWREVLELPEVSVHEKFFDAGGDSLKIVRLLLLLNQIYPNALTVVDLFKYNTIAEISSHLEEKWFNQEVEPAIQGVEL